MVGGYISCFFYIRFLVFCLESPGALTLGLTSKPFLIFLAFYFFISLYWFIMREAGGKKRGLASGTANLTGGEGIKKIHRG